MLYLMNTVIEHNQLSFLVLEDEEMEFTLFQHALKKGWPHTYSLIRVKSVEEATDYLQKLKFNVLFVDLNVLDSRGIDTVRKIKAQNHHDAVIIITTTLNDKNLAVEALKIGAQDYLVKGEYSASDLGKTLLFALARSSGSSSTPKDQMQLDDLKLDLMQQKLIYSDAHVSIEEELTPIDIKLLTYLIRHKDIEVSREDLLKNVVGEAMHVSSRTLDNQISRLRTKIEKTPYEILSIRGFGYRFGKS